MLPLLLLAGGTIASLGLQWHGQQEVYNLQRRKLQELESKMTQQARKAQFEAIKPILIGIAIIAVVYLLMKKR